MNAAPDAKKDPRQRGAEFEVRAEHWLTERGLVPLARNYSCRAGEIDLIMLDGESLVFVEVRYRRSDRFGGALESVDARKRARIIRAAQHYLARRGPHADAPCRFDVIAIKGSGEALSFDWIESAFSA